MLNNDERIDRVNENILLIQKKNGLTFGTDALLLAAFIKSSPKSIAIDFGSGTGIISFLLAARGKFKKIYAVEAQYDFFEIIQKNIEINNFSEKVFALHKDVRKLSYKDFGVEADVVLMYTKINSASLSPAVGNSNDKTTQQQTYNRRK